MRTGLNVLLSSALLLGGFVFPVTQHAHAGGERSHDHSPSCCEGDGRHHRHGVSHSHAWAQEGSAEVVHGHTLHRHATFFGIDFSMPLKDSQDVPHGGDDSMDDERVTFCRLVEADIEAGSFPAIRATCVDHSILCHASSNGIAISRRQHGREILSSLPLCDSARGERSGVQLI